MLLWTFLLFRSLRTCAVTLLMVFNVYSMFLRSTLDTSQARRLDLAISQEIFQS